MRKNSFEPPSLVLGNALRAQAPTAAIPTACSKAVRPVCVLIKFCELLERVTKASSNFPLTTLSMTVLRPVRSGVPIDPLLRSSSSVKPAAIPVIDGCGKLILRAMRFLGLLRRVKARRAVLRTCPFLVPLRPRRARRQAFLLMPPACLIAHLGSLPRLATQKARSQPHLSDTGLLRVALMTVLFPDQPLFGMTVPVAFHEAATGFSISHLPPVLLLRGRNGDRTYYMPACPFDLVLFVWV